MLRTTTDQKIDHRAVCRVVASIPTLRPTDHLQRVIVALSDDVAAGVR